MSINSDASEMKPKKAFTLIEVLVSLGILMLVSGAYVALSNSIVQGTGQIADETIVGNWASEGINIVTGIRDSRILSAAKDENGNPLWFSPASLGADRTQGNYQNALTYGWYRIKDDGTGIKTLVPLVGKLISPDHYKLSDELFSYDGNGNYFAEVLRSDSFEAARFICIESVRVPSPIHRAKETTEKKLGFVCNSAKKSGSDEVELVNDGSRDDLNGQGDFQFNPLVRKSINIDTANLNMDNSPDKDSEKIVPPGNIVKVRSVILWIDRNNEIKSYQIVSLLSNWMGYEQIN